MAYSDFTLKKAKQDFSLKLVEDHALFASLEPAGCSDWLTHTLARNVPLALSINTEKARSELIIINILLEIKHNTKDKISLFSGIDFTVDKEKNLTGFCDYILSGSAEQLYLEAPVITVVEAKNDNVMARLGQCVAEMVAAQLYNQQENNVVSSIYGAITTGDEWRFLKLTEDTVFIDRDAYYITDLAKIIGILGAMVQQSA